MRELFLRHARRISRIWYFGACLTFLIGAGIGLRSFYLLKTTDNSNFDMTEYGSIRYYDEDDFKEGMKTSAGIGLGFSAALIGLGFFSYAFAGYLLRIGTFTDAELEQASINALSDGTVSLLGLIAPVRAVAFKFKHDNSEIRQIGHLFLNELPYKTDDGKFQALKFNMFGKQVALLVCEEKR
jgi:hypothetical protein